MSNSMLYLLSSPFNDETDMMLRCDSVVTGSAVVSLEKRLNDVLMEKREEESSSRPPSPPDSGSTTPRLSIPPCPERLRPLIPPPNYGTVDIHAIYRSSFPQDRNMDFVRSLKIKSVLTLVDSPPSPGFQDWLLESSITQLNVNIATNKNGVVNTTLESLCRALLFIMDKSNHPLYIHCNQGKHRTGCVIGCLRKIQGLSMEEILAEYHAYAGPKAREGDISLIKSFEPTAVFEYASTHGYYENEEWHIRNGVIVTSRKEIQSEIQVDDIMLQL